MVVATAAAVMVVVWATWSLTRTPSPDASAPTAVSEVAGETSRPPTPSRSPEGADPGTGGPTAVGVPPSVAPAPAASSAVATSTPGPPETAAPPPPRSPAPQRERRKPKPPPRPPSPPADVVAAYSVSAVWESGFQASISLENTSPRPRDVVLTLTYPDGVTLPPAPECWWDVVCTQVGNTITLTTTSPLAPGARRFVGFNAERRPGPAPFDPVACTVNGSPCDAT